MRTFLTVVCVSAIVILISCDPCRRLAEKCHTSDSVEYIETIVQDPAYTIPDSLYWALEFWCDSTNKAIMRSFEEQNTGLEAKIEYKYVTRWVENPANPEMKQQLQLLMVDLTVISDSVKTLNSTITRLRREKTTVELPVEKPINRFTFWCTILFFLSIIAFFLWLWIKTKF